jgi:hypothetical protein
MMLCALVQNLITRYEIVRQGMKFIPGRVLRYKI